ncbi:RNA polymerase subunit sigma-70 [Solirubrobacter soli]|uniref:RNA polymerase subunit sigma-70 n=1 Tax=Solirubrobacter soli TaxID=363832 RepID=UPI0009FF8EEA|nr:RNA polymerase subunit sigma-70 [Solirubrobacter soli]
MSANTHVMTTDFEQAIERHRRELHVHCYRMLGSFDEAEDAIQEAFLRAWRARDTQTEEMNLRAWLYKIATNVCLDALRKSKRQVPVLESKADIPWLTPYPDRLLDEVAPAEQEPDAVVVARETIELTFITLIQLLPPRQRAVVILRDVLDWSAAETAALLEISVAAANSALQRARETLRTELPERRPVSADALSEDEQRLLAGFIAAHEACDAEASAALMREDIRITMPPLAMVYDGRDAIVPLLARAFGEQREGDWRLVPTRANRMPTAASYLRRPGETEWRAFKFDILRCVDGGVAEITTFGPALFEQFGLPVTL